MGIKNRKTSNDAIWFPFDMNTDYTDKAEPIDRPEGFVLSEDGLPTFLLIIMVLLPVLVLALLQSLLLKKLTVLQLLETVL